MYIYVYLIYMYTSFFICHGFPEMRKAAFVAKAVHGLVCAAIIAANLGSVELGQQPQHFVARHFLQPQPFVAGHFQRM